MCYGYGTVEAKPKSKIASKAAVDTQIKSPHDVKDGKNSIKNGNLSLHLNNSDAVKKKINSAKILLNPAFTSIKRNQEVKEPDKITKLNKTVSLAHKLFGKPHSNQTHHFHYKFKFNPSKFYIVT